MHELAEDRLLCFSARAQARTCRGFATPCALEKRVSEVMERVNSDQLLRSGSTGTALAANSCFISSLPAPSPSLWECLA